MTITEAAQLVIQAGAMGENSEVFVLDMGESVKIYDLIVKMINLSGLKVKNKNNPEGDIEIKIIGLRPGEKLYEELLIGDNPSKTNHPKIKKTSDQYISFEKLKVDLKILKSLIENNKVIEVKSLLNKLVELYRSNSEIVDHVYVEQNIIKNYDQNSNLLKKKNINSKDIDNKVVNLK